MFERAPVDQKIRREALAFRVWAYCTPKGWDVTYQEVADEMGLHVNSIITLAQRKGWLGRFRTSSAAGRTARECHKVGRPMSLNSLMSEIGEHHVSDLEAMDL